jgi:hypothetical protein
MPRRGLLISLAVFALAGIGGMGVLVKRSSQSRGTLSLAHNTITVTAQDQSERVRVVEAEVTNTGVKPVTITRITSSCGCTTPQLPSGTTILPGRSMRLPVRLQLPAAGERKGSRVVIETADDKSDPVEVRFELVGYTLKPPYIVSQPERITLSTSDPSQRCIGRLRIHTCENRGAHWLNTLGGAQEGTTVRVATRVRCTCVSEEGVSGGANRGHRFCKASQACAMRCGRRPPVACGSGVDNRKNCFRGELQAEGFVDRKRRPSMGRDGGDIGRRMG